MARYAIAFDIDTAAMKSDSCTESSISALYQSEIPQALAQCGFTAHPQGSLYHTEEDTDPLMSIIQLQKVLQKEAPNFCKYAKKVHVFRMEEWSDVTELFAEP